MTTKRIARSALIAAIYAAVSSLLPAISYGPLQFRISEALTLLPVIMPEAIPGLVIGCFITNMLSFYGVYDMIFGTFATLVAAILTYLLRRKIILAALPPIILNALIVPIIFILSGDEASLAGYLFNVFLIFLSQAVIIMGLGIPLTLGLKKTLPLKDNDSIK